jgi:hypothetical protein
MIMSTPLNSRNSTGIADSGVRPIENNRRSQNIPLPMSHMHRTQSEAQLREDMESAEQRDLNMFYRLVNGIRERQMNLVRENESSDAAAAFYNPSHELTEAERSLAHIIHTRNSPLDRKTASLKFGTKRTSRNPSLNSGVPILEDRPNNNNNMMDQDENHDNEWSVAGFDSSSNTAFDPQHPFQNQQQSPFYHQHGVGGATSASNPTVLGSAPSSASLHPSQSSGNIADEGMFDFEL